MTRIKVGVTRIKVGVTRINVGVTRIKVGVTRIKVGVTRIKVGVIRYKSDAIKSDRKPTYTVEHCQRYSTSLRPTYRDLSLHFLLYLLSGSIISIEWFNVCLFTLFNGSKLCGKHFNFNNVLLPFIFVNFLFKRNICNALFCTVFLFYNAIMLYYKTFLEYKL